MLGQAMLFLLDTLLSLVAGAFLLRFYMQALRAPFRNPAGQFLLALTDFAVRPLRRVLPGLWGYDLASLVAAWGVEWILVIASFALLGHAAAFPGALAGLAFLAAVKLLALSINLLMWIVIIGAIFSWVQPYHWLNTLAATLSAPFLRPLRRFIPLIGSVDLSPLVLILACQVALMVPVVWLDQLAGQLF